MQTLAEARQELWDIVLSPPTEYSDQAVVDWSKRMNAAKKLVFEEARRIRKIEKDVLREASMVATETKAGELWNYLAQEFAGPNVQKQDYVHVVVHGFQIRAIGYRDWFFREEAKKRGYFVYKPQGRDAFYVSLNS